MQSPSIPSTPARKPFLIYLIGFLFALHYCVPIYINSTFLAEYSSAETVGLIYALASLLTIGFFSLVPGFLERVGNYRTIQWLMVIEFLCLIGMAVGATPWLIIPFFIVSYIMIAVINFNIDIFLEHFVSKDHIGKFRGIYLTTVNVAWLFSPLLGSAILDGGEAYWRNFLVAAIVLVPVFFLVRRGMRGFVDPLYTKTPLLGTFRDVWANKNMLGAFMTNFILQFFFAWMVIYTPLYLHDTIGFSWGTLGIMLSVMLIPFTVTELPLGRLADTKYGEKEIMSLGFIIIAISTAFMSFISVPSAILWTVVLFVTRIGASMVEIMTETYFFKIIQPTDVNTKSLFRTMRPLSYLAGPVAASVLLIFLPMKFLFLVLGVIMLYGLRFSLSLEDTR